MGELKMNRIENTRAAVMPPLEEQERLKETSTGRQVEAIKVESNTKTPSTANKVSNFVKTMFKAIANAFANFYNKVTNFFHKDSRKVEQAPAKIEAPVTKAPVVEDAVVAAPVQIDPTEVKQEAEEAKPTNNASTPWLTAGKAALALGTVALGGYAASSYFGGMANATMASPVDSSSFTCPANFTPLNPVNAMVAYGADQSIASLAAGASTLQGQIPSCVISGKVDWIGSGLQTPLASVVATVNGKNDTNLNPHLRENSESKKSITERIVSIAQEALNGVKTAFSNLYNWLFTSSSKDNQSGAMLAIEDPTSQNPVPASMIRGEHDGIGSDLKTPLFNTSSILENFSPPISDKVTKAEISQILGAEIGNVSNFKTSLPDTSSISNNPNLNLVQTKNDIPITETSSTIIKVAMLLKNFRNWVGKKTLTVADFMPKEVWKFTPNAFTHHETRSTNSGEKGKLLLPPPAGKITPTPKYIGESFENTVVNLKPIHPSSADSQLMAMYRMSSMGNQTA